MEYRLADLELRLAAVEQRLSKLEGPVLGAPRSGPHIGAAQAIDLSVGYRL